MRFRRHFGPASKASRQPAGLLRPLCGLSEACLLSSYGLPKATLGILDRLQKPLGSRQASCGLSVACPKPASSLLMRFRRHFGPASKASRQPAGLLRPLCGLSEACLLSSYGLPKATLGILDRLQKPLGSRQASCGLSVACPKPASSLLMGCEGNVRHFGPASKASRQPAGLLRPLCGLSEACLLLSSYGLPKATLGILARLQTLPRASPQPCPLLGSWLNASIGVKPIQVSLLNPRKLSRFNRQTLEMKRGRRHPGGALTIR